MNPYALWALAPQASASANFATSARGELYEYTKNEGIQRGVRPRMAGPDSLSMRAQFLGLPGAGFAVAIRARMRFSASALQYLQSSRMKTEV